MPNYCVLSQNKIKTLSELNALYAHNARKYTPNNCNPELHSLNEYMITTTDYQKLFKNMMKKYNIHPRHNEKHPQHNSVLALEYTSKFSYGSRINLDEWKEQNRKFFEDTFGKENVVSMIVHYDEHAPHIHTLIIPVVKRKKKKKDGTEEECYSLNAKNFTGGRQAMLQLQKTYETYMKPLGLQKGTRIKKEKAAHEDIAMFYKNITQSARYILPPAKENETLESYLNRATPTVREELMNSQRIINKLKQELHEANITLEENKVLLQWAKIVPDLAKKLQALTEADLTKILETIETPNITV